ncbi:MAG: PQQ-binding-like beta-propeller repeat protein [Opitutae bacterium]|nr:PQQ-binding-like beta-propeller repeat protein [Opitutae bacterium]
MHEGGPTGSVTIVGGKAFAISKDGQVFCLNAENGSEIWSVKLTQLLRMEVPQWGFGSSPVEYKGDLLISAGRTVALDKETGKPSWISSEDRKAGYGTPVVFTRSGKDYIATMDAEGLSILDAADGAEIARYGQRVKYDMNASTPAVFANGEQILFYTNSNSAMLAFDGETLTSIWEDRKLQNALSGSILMGKALYGLNGSYKNKKTSLYSRNLGDGKENWVVPDYGYATLIAVGDTLVILTEDGELVTASANAERYRELSRKKLLEAICWTHPTYADGRIFVRNEHGALICLTPA